MDEVFLTLYSSLCEARSSGMCHSVYRFCILQEMLPNPKMKWKQLDFFFVFFPHKPSLTHIICFSTGLCIDTGIIYIYSIIGSSVFADSSTESASWTATRAAVIMRHMQNWSWKPVGRKNSWESLRFQLKFDMSALNTGRLDVFSLL